MEPTRHNLHLPHANGQGRHEVVFYDWGSPDAKQVTICVHGLTRNARDFDALATELAKRGRRVLSLNMAGRGESEWLSNSDDYNYGTYVADCLAVMDNFHLRRVEWVGTSMGGIIGMSIAAAQPDRIRRMVLNDVGSHLPAAALRRIYDYLKSMPRSFTTRAEAETYLAEIFKPFGITDPAMWKTFVDHSLVERGGTLHYACDPAIVDPIRRDTKDFTEVKDVNIAAVWEQVKIPVLILRGELSDVLEEETVKAMRSTNPSAQAVTVPGVGHAPALVSPEQIQLVADWLTVTERSILGI